MSSTSSQVEGLDSEPAAARPALGHQVDADDPLGAEVPAIRAANWPIGPRPEHGQRPALGHVGVGDRLLRGGQDVGQVQELLVRAVRPGS